jgi:hypothetical protein
MDYINTYFGNGDDSLYIIKVSDNLGNEFIPYINELIKMVTIQFLIQFMLFLKTPKLSIIFNFEFLEILTYIVLGLSLYWFAVKKLIIAV